MFAKKKRLTRTEFDHFFKIGKRFHAESLTLVFYKNNSFHGSVVVGKKVLKKAVDRNRLRRRVYGLLRTHLVTTDGVYIALLKPKAGILPFNRVKQECLALLKSIHQE